MYTAGQTLGSYWVVRQLGEGGMGSVYEVMHRHIGRRAAIKVLHPEYSQRPGFMTRFLNEARAVNLVGHPGLVEIYEFGQLDDGTAFIVMELLLGDTIRTRMQRGDGQLANIALQLGRQIALAVQAAHEKAIVHRGPWPPGERRSGFSAATRSGGKITAAVLLLVRCKQTPALCRDPGSRFRLGAKMPHVEPLFAQQVRRSN